MIITLKPGATEDQINNIIEKIQELNFNPEVSKGEEKTLILVKGENAILTREVFEAFDIVDVVTPISESYKMVSKHWKDRSEINVDGVVIGGEKLVFIAGPCSVEDMGTMMKVAHEIKKSGASILR